MYNGVALTHAFSPAQVGVGVDRARPSRVTISHHWCETVQRSKRHDRDMVGGAGCPLAVLLLALPALAATGPGSDRLQC